MNYYILSFVFISLYIRSLIVFIFFLLVFLSFVVREGDYDRNIIVLHFTVALGFVQGASLLISANFGKPGIFRDILLIMKKSEKTKEL